MGSATASAYHTGQQEAGAGTIGGGLGGISNAARGRMAGTSTGGKVRAPRAPPVMNAAPGPSASTSQGQSGSAPGSEAAQDNSDATPNWARKLQSRQNARHRRQMITHALQSGDRGGHGANPDIKEKED
jgi:type IV secretion system protein TrbL